MACGERFDHGVAGVKARYGEPGDSSLHAFDKSSFPASIITTMALRFITKSMPSAMARSQRRFIAPTTASKHIVMISWLGEFPGGQTVPYVNKITVLDPKEQDIIPAYRILDQQGKLVTGGQVPEGLNEEVIVDLYKNMVRLNVSLARSLLM
ncbi:hypothetical protein DYB37_003964 [Aphanomyces astaci]|uniref:Uncharacterized protein n=1 Tax=Aphanomyces astaci TaxID=112090 RepID=A0A3R6X5D3_APHAT|nr:hypothetical protein DYB35_010399 [Aphanomyces astaci]RHZ15272.1 hypothetical protein DYB37_003964 [Aphanomyces astaci]